MAVIRTCFVLLAILLIEGCSRQAEEPAIGEGFVAPATLNLRKDLGPRQPSVGAAQHGERVEILARRRKFAKVRTGAGAVGWIDGEQLFTPEQMAELRALGARAETMPNQGNATVLDVVNVHTHADRGSPSYHQIKPGEPAAVLEHRLVARTLANLPPDDWTLVRHARQEAGWVLTRSLYMSIPDEVAQYAEGHRITSYFALSDVNDGGQVKHDWLWTTIVQGRQPYEFDSFRVFVWSLRRHRYETAHIERNLKGYYPVIVDRTANPRFTLMVEEKDGTRVLKTYTFQGFHIRMVAKSAAAPPPQPAEPEATAAPRPGPNRSLFARVRAAAESTWQAVAQRLKK